MDLVFDKKSGGSERIPLKGRLSLVNKNGEWLIQADDFDASDYAKLIPQE